MDEPTELEKARAQITDLRIQLWKNRVTRQADIIWELRKRLSDNGLPPSTGRDFYFDDVSDIELLYPTRKETSNE